MENKIEKYIENIFKMLDKAYIEKDFSEAKDYEKLLDPDELEIYVKIYDKWFRDKAEGDDLYLYIEYDGNVPADKIIIESNSLDFGKELRKI